MPGQREEPEGARCVHCKYFKTASLSWFSAVSCLVSDHCKYLMCCSGISLLIQERWRNLYTQDVRPHLPRRRPEREHPERSGCGWSPRLCTGQGSLAEGLKNKLRPPGSGVTGSVLSKRLLCAINWGYRVLFFFFLVPRELSKGKAQRESAPVY